MNKQIIFLLLVITSTTVHGMKRPANIFHNDDATNCALVLFDRDLLLQITAGICNKHNYQPKEIRKDIRALSNTNRFFHNHYAQEKVKQEIIDLCLPYHNSNSKDIARDLGCHGIHAKIERLTDIVRNKEENFNENDLKDPWYLAVTTTYKLDYNIYQQPLNQSLLYIAIDYRQLEKAITILKNTKKLHFNYEDEQNLLLKIVQYRAFFTKYQLWQENDPNQYLTLTQGLLQKGIDPNGRGNNSQYTPLLCSVKHADTELVRLLLKYGANPYLEGYDGWNKKTVNAFDLEPEKGWLQNIIDDVKESKKLKCETLL